MDEGAVSEGVGDEKDAMNEEVTDDKDNMDEGAVNEGIGNEEEVIEVTDEVKNEDDRDKGGVMDEKVRDEDEEVWDKEDRNERVIGGVMDEKVRDEDEEVWDKEDRNERVIDEEVRNEGVGTFGDEAVEVPIYNKVNYNYINEHTLYLSLMY